jgi:hypothetical protein
MELDILKIYRDYLHVLLLAPHQQVLVLGGSLGALVPVLRQRNLACPVLHTRDEGGADLGGAGVSRLQTKSF